MDEINAEIALYRKEERESMACYWKCEALS
jgi:hypothetical protein